MQVTDTDLKHWLRIAGVRRIYLSVMLSIARVLIDNNTPFNEIVATWKPLRRHWFK